MGTQGAIEHPSRNLQPSSSIRPVKRATENGAPRPLDHRMDANIAPKPRMKAIQNFSPSRPVGVLKLRCTTPTDRTRAFRGSRPSSLQTAPRRGITRTDSTYERGHVGEQVSGNAIVSLLLCPRTAAGLLLQNRSGPCSGLGLLRLGFLRFAAASFLALGHNFLLGSLMNEIPWANLLLIARRLFHVPSDAEVGLQC